MDDIKINIWEVIDKTFLDCKYYCKPLLNYGYFTLGNCNNPRLSPNNEEGVFIVQCRGSSCKYIELLKDD